MPPPPRLTPLSHRHVAALWAAQGIAPLGGALTGLSLVVLADERVHAGPAASVSGSGDGSPAPAAKGSPFLRSKEVIGR